MSRMWEYLVCIVKEDAFLPLTRVGFRNYSGNKFGKLLAPGDRVAVFPSTAPHSSHILLFILHTLQFFTQKVC